MRKPCEACGEAITSRYGTRFCSQTCANRRQKPNTSTCEACGVVFAVKRHKIAEGKGHYCSRTCYRATVKRAEKHCASCGCVIPETGWHHEAKYCSQACYRTHQPRPAWKGGRIIDTDGYVLIWAPNSPMAREYGYVAEHRLVMAEVIGRPLTTTEVVHHVNGDRADNAPSNLMLFASQIEHMRHHAGH